MDRILLKNITNTFSKELVGWYFKNKRELPWRETTDSYKIWLSEIILQQTQIKQGLPYYLRFVNNYPNVKALASASENEILKMWEGLGYYSRARNLHKTAKIVTKDFNEIFPITYLDLIKLPGIGDYSASAISSFSNNEVVSVVDGNVYRFISRLLGIDTPINTSKSLKEFKEVTMKLISKDNPSDFNQAIMEFGAMVCKPAIPFCNDCIFRYKCYAYKNNMVFNFPFKKKNKKSINRFFNYLVFLSEKNKTIIEKRENKGIWQNLYQFPLLETDKLADLNEIINHVESLENLTGQSEGIELFENKNLVHKLSHQNISISFWIVSVKTIKANSISLKKASSYPFPKPLSNFLSIFKLQ
ncbi:MAG: A/G-specific adenine glycosylase [Flavobacteriales bacterium]